MLTHQIGGGVPSHLVRTIGGGQTFSWVAPAGLHIMSFWGAASGSSQGWDGNVERLGVYYGRGGGSAGWTVADAVDRVPLGVTYEYSMCSKTEQSAEIEDSSSWTVSTKTEMKIGFSLHHLAASGSLALAASYTRSLVSRHRQAFTFEHCMKKNIYLSHEPWPVRLVLPLELREATRGDHEQRCDVQGDAAVLLAWHVLGPLL
uniref:Uncharacterized protein n=1 Tax=Zooxanthella nutricula TaxID=1333877 RepID=A0A6V0DG49_9DINO|mmetsp:Transcript_100975/g.308776  ORF Transcript_100975/g.308776 Transcript_100975/m.308776 type:complete len:203 (+) Transcript_100975:490-1098(+)